MLQVIRLWLVIVHNMTIGFCGSGSYFDFLATFSSTANVYVPETYETYDST